MIKGHGLARWKIKWDREQHQKGKEPKGRGGGERDGKEEEKEIKTTKNGLSHTSSCLLRGCTSKVEEEEEDELGVPSEMSPPV